MRLYHLLAVLLFLLSACDPITEVDDIELPQGKQLISVYALLREEGELQAIYVGQTLPIGYDKFLPLNRQKPQEDDTDTPLSFPTQENAKVELEDLNTGTKLLIDYDNEKARYVYPSNLLPLLKAHRYRLRVAVPNLPSVESEATLPSGEKLLCAVDTTEFLQVQITAPKEEKRFFVVYAYNTNRVSKDKYEVVDYDYIATEDSNDGVVRAVFGDNVFGFNANKRNLNAIEVYELTEPMYRFMKSASLAKNSASPFSSPVAVQGNITGGRGGFGIAKLVYHWE